MDWRSRAACLDKDPELFFPVGNTGPALLQIEEAKSVCRRCPVMDTCLPAVALVLLFIRPTQVWLSETEPQG